MLFFRRNTEGAERLYEAALKMIPDLEGKVAFDLFSGTGTIWSNYVTES